MTEIIATVSLQSPNIVQTIDYLISCNINTFRFNLAKFFDLLIIEKVIDDIISIKQTYGTRIKIMLDIPYPYQKSRIYIEDVLKLKAGDTCHIFNKENTVNISKGVCLKTNAVNFGKYLKNEDKIIYGDGRHAFIVKKVINPNYIEVQLYNDTVIYPGKSIHIKHFTMEGVLTHRIIKKIHKLKPEYIALSFVSDENSVEKVKNIFPGVNIISKIETHEGIENINQISEESDIMIARGDLLLNVDYSQFLNCQQTIASTAKNNQRKLFVATGILSSLSNSVIPTQSEIVDLLILKKMSPNALILNYGLIDGNIEEALSIINTIFNREEI